MATEIPIPSTEEIVNNLIKNYQTAILSKTGIEASIDPGSDIFLQFQSQADQLTLLYSYLNQKTNSIMPDTAVEDDLDRLLFVYGLTRKSAGPSQGFTILNSSSSTNVTEGTQLSSAGGLVFEVIQGGIYSNGEQIQIRSVDVGSQTNLPAGTILTWISTPANAKSTSITTAITGGCDVETDAAAQSRLQSRFSNPPSLGNWQHLVELISAFDTIGSQVWIYSCANGPSTQHIAISTPQSVSYVGRDVPVNPNMANIASATFGNVAAYANTVITSVSNVPFDVAFKITIPYPIGSSNNSSTVSGGGWLDFNPFPVPDGYFFNFSSVSAVTSTVNFTINLKNGNTKCIPNLTRISWIDRSNSSGNGWIVKTAKVIAVTENLTLNTYTLTIDTPFTGITVGDYIFPAMTNGQNYLNTVLEQFGLLGPGQKTDVPSIVNIASRNPSVNDIPSIIDSQFLSALVTDNNQTVKAADFWYRQYGSAEPPLATNTPPSGAYTLDLESSVYYQTIYENINETEVRRSLSTIDIKSQPYIYTPNQVAFYPVR